MKSELMPTKNADNATTKEVKGTLSSGIRCLQILRLLSSAEEDMALQDVAAATDLHPSTAHRILATLVSQGFVDQQHDRRYRLGIEAFAVGAGFLRRSTIRRSAAPHLVRLAKQTNTSSTLAVWHRGSVVVLECVPMPGMYSFYTETGSFLPAHATAVGKVLLAFRRNPELKGLALTRYTPHTISTLSALNRELDKVRSQGYAVDDEESILGCRCVAAPVFQSGSDAVASISVSAAPSSLSLDRVDDVASLVKEVTMSVSVQAGYRPIENPMMGR